ncbi:MAG: ADP-ribosylglycohydrolase family protein, partial [Bacteroidales bacterium]|nr:ADP-ribosylglycohydrolase family protein [Bacteroidales bacterium]
MILGAIIGDTMGSIYEFNNHKSVDFPLFDPQCEFTDDSIVTVAVAKWLITDPQHTMEKLEECLVDFGTRYPNPMGGYGGGYLTWLFHPQRLTSYGETNKSQSGRHPYNSWGNGSAMRVSAVGWAFDTLEETLEIAKRSAEITHNHPEGIKGAQATAAAIFLARNGKSKQEIKDYITNTFGYDLSRTCNDIRPHYHFDGSCQGTVPEAMTAFMDSTDFESAIRLGVSIGGDTDTLVCITSGIAEAFYKKIPQWIIDKILTMIPQEFKDILGE